MNLAIPTCDVNVRPATVGDLPFMDELQKRHSKQVGWMPTKTLEGKIERGEVLIAEMRGKGVEGQRGKGECEGGDPPFPLDLCPSVPSSLVGYLIASDRYMKREDVGVVYQINVMPGSQRGFVGASLLKAQFERSAYGCRLYCCWCAQDIEANKFWEAMGFVPLAFRAGSEKKARVHIFWQKRIRAGDVTTPYWFPSQTTGGSIREDRLVLPIPPGTRWSDAKPMVLPREELPVASGQLPVKAEKRKPQSSALSPQSSPPRRSMRPHVQFGRPPSGPIALVPVAAAGGVPAVAPVPVPAALPAPVAVAKVAAKPKKPKAKNDPKLVAAARELRDRWLEQVNAPGGNALLPVGGKYEVSRALPEPAGVPQLTMAA